MKDISPTERAVLERAAQHVKVYERLLGDKPDLVDPPEGCFGCNHAVGPLGANSSYDTFALGAYYGQPDGPSVDAAFTIARSDRFWGRPEAQRTGFYSVLKYAIGNGRMPQVYDFTYSIPDLFQGLKDPSLYVRQYWTPKTGLRHVNSRVDILELLEPARWTSIDFEPDIRVWCMPTDRYGFTYIDPSELSIEMLVDGRVPWETLRIASDSNSGVLARCRKYWNVSAGPQLKPIKPKGGQKKTTKKKKLSWPYEEAVFGGTNAFTLDTIIEGDS